MRHPTQTGDITPQDRRHLALVTVIPTCCLVAGWGAYRLYRWAITGIVAYLETASAEAVVAWALLALLWASVAVLLRGGRPRIRVERQTTIARRIERLR